MSGLNVGGGSHPGSDKAVEAAIVAITAKVGDVKGSLSSFVGKMEHESLTWPSVLDSFSALSGHYSTLMKQLNNEKIPPLQGQILLPHQVSSDRDTDLERTTEGRIPILHHEVVPDYMRTKLELDLEAKQRELHITASKPSPQFQEELSKYNGLLDKVIASVEEARDSWEKQSNRFDGMQVNSAEDTKRLVAAYLNGTGLQAMSQSRKLSLMGGKQLTQQQQPAYISRVTGPSPAVRPMQMNTVPPNPPPFHTSPYKPR